MPAWVALLVGAGLVVPGPVAVDLGTLGGAASSASAVNEAGVVVGWAETADGQRHATRWDRNGITDLGTVGGVWSHAGEINARGEIAGGLVTAAGDRHAARWDANGIGVDLGTLPGGRTSAATGISGSGVIVGNADAPIPGGFVMHAVRWDASGLISDLGRAEANDVNGPGVAVGVAGGHAVRWDAQGDMAALDRLDGSVASTASKINDAGVIVGVATTADGDDHAVKWDSAGRITDLGTLPGGTYSMASAIGRDGTVVGISTVAAGYAPTHAVRWDRRGRLTDLGAGEASGINRHGMIIGRSDLDAVWWDQRGRLHKLTGLGDDPSPNLTMINDRRIVVGESDSRATLWRL